MPSSRQRVESPNWPDEVSIMIVAPPRSGCDDIFSATVKPSITGMLASSSTIENGMPRRVGQRRQRRRAAVDRHRLHPPARQRLVEDAAVDVVVIDDQHRQADEDR